jgi:hypothetical protein
MNAERAGKSSNCSGHQVFVWNHRLVFHPHKEEVVGDGGSRSQGVSDFAALGQAAPSALVTFKMKRLFSSSSSLKFFCAGRHNSQPPTTLSPPL